MPCLFPTSTSTCKTLASILFGALLFFIPFNFFGSENLMSDTEEAISVGCTDINACNYDASAVEDDGSCDYFSCITFGCTNASACNYDASVDYDDGSCDFISCAGCMNTNACDFDPEATIAGVCSDFTSCVGCMDSSADNYAPSATIESGYCTYSGCTISVACNMMLLRILMMDLVSIHHVLVVLIHLDVIMTLLLF